MPIMRQRRQWGRDGKAEEVGREGRSAPDVVYAGLSQILLVSAVSSRPTTLKTFDDSFTQDIQPSGCLIVATERSIRPDFKRKYQLI